MPPLQPSQITVLVDTQEKEPYTFLAPHKDGVPMGLEEATLQTGDYGIKGLPDVRGERKRFDEMATILGNTAERARFKRELERLIGFRERIVIIEGDWKSLCSGNYRSRVDPFAATNAIMSWLGEFCIPFFPAHDRAMGQHAMACFLFNAARREHERREAFYAHVPPPDGAAASTAPESTAKEE